MTAYSAEIDYLAGLKADGGAMSGIGVASDAQPPTADDESVCSDFSLKDVGNLEHLGFNLSPSESDPDMGQGDIASAALPAPSEPEVSVVEQAKPDEPRASKYGHPKYRSEWQIETLTSKMREAKARKLWQSKS